MSPYLIRGCSKPTSPYIFSPKRKVKARGLLKDRLQLIRIKSSLLLKNLHLKVRNSLQAHLKEILPPIITDLTIVGLGHRPVRKLEAKAQILI